jgi:hypothetical protein
MSGEEATITVNRNPAEPVAAPKSTVLLDAQEASRKAREALQANTNQTRASDEEKAQEGLPETPHEPIEDVESVEVQLPNGLLIEFGPPKNISLNMKIIKILGDNAASMLVSGLYRILLSVRSVNGKQVPPINNTIDAEKLANQIGDDGIDILSLVSSKHWKPLKLDQLPVIKKNLRNS